MPRYKTASPKGRQENGASQTLYLLKEKQLILSYRKGDDGYSALFPPWGGMSRNDKGCLCIIMCNYKWRKDG